MKIKLFIAVFFTLFIHQMYAQDDVIDLTEESSHSVEGKSENKKIKKDGDVDAKGFYLYLGYNFPLDDFSSLESYGSIDMGYHVNFWTNNTGLINVGMDIGFVGFSAYTNIFDELIFQTKGSIGPLFSITKSIFSVYTSYKVGYGSVINFTDTFEVSDVLAGLTHDVNLGFAVKKFSIKTTFDFQNLQDDFTSLSFNAVKVMIGFRF